MDLIDARAAAKLLGVSLSRVRQMYRVENQLVCYRNGKGDVRLDRDAVLKLAADRSTYHSYQQVSA